MDRPEVDNSVVMTRTPETDEGYRELFQKLRIRVSRILRFPKSRSAPAPQEWAAFLCWVQLNRRPSTFRQYRACIFHHFNGRGDFQSVSNIGSWIESPDKATSTALRLITESMSTAKVDISFTAAKMSGEFNPLSFEPCIEVVGSVNRDKRRFGSFSKSKNRVIRGPSKKVKRVPEDVFNQVRDEVGLPDNTFTNFEAFCKLMFVCSVVYGLRPSEFANCEVIDDQLVVLNGKNSNGRATGEYRQIPLSVARLSSFLEKAGHPLGGASPGEETPGDARTFLGMRFVQFRGHVTALLLQFEDLLSKEVLEERLDMVDAVSPLPRKAFLKRFLKKSSRVFQGTKPKVCLYSARHQFSANLKSIFDPDVVAQAMGHASELTCQNHYARKSVAHGGFKSIGVQTNKDLQSFLTVMSGLKQELPASLDLNEAINGLSGLSPAIGKR